MPRHTYLPILFLILLNTILEAIKSSIADPMRNLTIFYIDDITSVKQGYSNSQITPVLEHPLVLFISVADGIDIKIRPKKYEVMHLIRQNDPLIKKTIIPILIHNIRTTIETSSNVGILGITIDQSISLRQYIKKSIHKR
jgi:hypothetical protein